MGEVCENSIAVNIRVRILVEIVGTRRYTGHQGESHYTFVYVFIYKVFHFQFHLLEIKLDTEVDTLHSRISSCRAAPT